MDISLSGLEGVMNILDRMDEGEILQAARKGLQAGLQDIRGEAQMLCPVDTGELSNSIKTRTRIEGGTLIGETYTANDHAIFVEMGTGPKGEANHAGVDPEMAAKVTYSPKGWTYKAKDGSFRHTRGMPARPYLYPAFVAQSENVKRKIARAVIRHAQKGSE